MKILLIAVIIPIILGYFCADARLAMARGLGGVGGRNLGTGRRCRGHFCRNRSEQRVWNRRPTAERYRQWEEEDKWWNNLRNNQRSRKPRETYDCSAKLTCYWENYVESIDYGYYSRTSGDCRSCKERCSNDLNCGGIECDGGYCSWWSTGQCNTEELGPGDVTTCLKRDRMGNSRPCTGVCQHYRSLGLPNPYE